MYHSVLFDPRMKLLRQLVFLRFVWKHQQVVLSVYLMKAALHTAEELHLGRITYTPTVNNSALHRGQLKVFLLGVVYLLIFGERKAHDSYGLYWL